MFVGTRAEENGYGYYEFELILICDMKKRRKKNKSPGPLILRSDTVSPLKSFAYIGDPHG